MSDALQALPHALGVEKAVLSVLFQWPEMFDQCDALTADHFYLPSHRTLFDAIRQTHAAGHDLELVSFVERLRKIDMLDRVGGPGAITDIYCYQPGTGALPRHIEILTENLVCRLSVKHGNDMIAAGYSSDPETVTDCARTAATAIEETATGASAPPKLGAILMESMERFEARVRGTEDSMGIPTLALLDERLRGLHPGRLWVIGAYPEGGKSVLASQIILDVALGGAPAIFLSLEMSPRDVMDRMIVQAARVDAKAFMEPKAYGAEHGTDGITRGLMMPIQRAVAAIKDAPLRVQRPGNRKLSTIIAAIKRARREMGIKVAAVDYLQLVKGSGDAGNREGEISEVSHALQEVAQDCGITLLILSQLNADGDTKHGRVIEEDADAVLNIIQDRNKESDTYKMHRHILIAKDRHYGSGGERVRLILDRERIRFVEGQDQTVQSKPKFNR